MNRKDLYNAINEVDNDILERSETASQSKKKPQWLKWIALAACLCLMVAVAIPTIFYQSVESPNDTIAPGDGPPSLVVNGISYCISSYLAVTSESPDGFVQSGEVDVGGF